MKIKKLNYAFAVLMITGIFLSCKKDAANNQLPSTMAHAETTCISLPAGFDAPESGPYNVELVQSNAAVTGGYQWTWKVAKNEGAQDLSHWDLFLPECIGFTDVVSTSYSYDNSQFTSFVPSYQADKSLNDCSALSEYCVVKFDVGHTETDKVIYYRMVISKPLTAGPAFSIYKSGKNTGCGAQKIQGLSCLAALPQGCVMSQGYWFANPKSWPEGLSLTIGGKSYSEAEARNIFSSSNASGISVCKQAFLQGGAVKLSMAADPNIVLPQTIVDALSAIENYLSAIEKLQVVTTTVNKKPASVVSCSPGASTQQINAASAAAGMIGTWIANQLCHQTTSTTTP